MRRNRERTFQSDRNAYPLRIGRNLYEAVTRACEEAAMPTTLFVSTQLGLALATDDWLQCVDDYQDEGSADRVMVTIRLLPSLHVNLKRAAKRHNVSMNRLILSVLQAALRA
jgi:hypothetical protein